MGPLREPVNILFGAKDEKLTEMCQPIMTSLLNGFQTCVSKGPLCGEPLMSVAFFIDDIKFPVGNEGEDSSRFIPGQIIPLMRDACYDAFSLWSPRLMLAMYLCDIQCTGK